MSTRSIIARKKGNGFEGVYHHWDGYPEGVGQTLFKVNKKIFAGDTERMLKFLIDEHKGGWSTINGDWRLPASAMADNDDNESLCTKCQKPAWMHYRQYYTPSPNSTPSAWERYGRPKLPEGTEVMVLGHSAETPKKEKGPLFYGPERACEDFVTEKEASGMGCEYAYIFDGAGHMEIYSSFNPNGSKMIGFFGSGNEGAAWRLVARIRLKGATPDWAALTKNGQEAVYNAK